MIADACGVGYLYFVYNPYFCKKYIDAYNVGNTAFSNSMAKVRR